MNKKGFTLPELLGVIVILAIIISVVSISVVSIVNKAKNNLAKEMEDNLKEAAITCYLDKKDENSCNTTQKLIENNYFEDKKGYCAGITIEIKTTEDGYSAILTGSCKN